MKLASEQAAEWLRTNTRGFQFVDLPPAEVLNELETAQSRNVNGARVHDYLHAVAAQQARADALLTRNQNDLNGLTGNVPVV